MDSNRDIVMRVREALDYQAAAQAGRNPNERRPLADVLAEQVPGELIPGLRQMYLTMIAMSAQWQQKGFQAAANGGVPAAANAIAIRISTSWSAASQNSYAYARANGGSDVSVVCRALVANINHDSQGIVGIGTNGDIQVIVAGATANGALVSLLGWFM